jgi:hypothetical protein
VGILGNCHKSSGILFKSDEFSGIPRNTQEILQNSQEFSAILRILTNYREFSGIISIFQDFYEFSGIVRHFRNFEQFS